jgi:hypothetical protein
MGRLFAFGQFFITGKAKFLATFSCGKRNVLIFYKNALGHILGDFDHKRIWSPWP